MRDSAADTKLQACLNLNHPQRRTALEKLTQEIPEFLPAKLSLAKEYFSLGQLQTLMDYLNQDSKYSLILYLQLSQWLINNNLLSYAIQLLEDKIQKKEDNLFVYIKLGEAYLVQEDFVAAKKYFDIASDLARNNIRVRLFELKLQLSQGNHLLAQRILNKIDRTKINQLPLVLQLAEQSNQLKDYETTNELYDQALTLATSDEQRIDLKLNQIEFLISQKASTKVRADLKELAQKFPTNGTIKIVQASLALEEGHKHEAYTNIKTTVKNKLIGHNVTAANKLINLIPMVDKVVMVDILKLYTGNHLGLLRWKGLFAMNQGQYKDAYEVLQPLVARYPFKIGIQLLWARLNMKVGTYKEVENTMNKLLKYYPDAAPARELALDCYLIQGKLTMSSKFLKYCENQSELNEHLKVLWAKYYKAKGQFDAGISSLEKDDTSSVEKAYLLAELYLLKYEYEKALPYLNIVIEKNYSVQNAIRLKARTLMITGRWEETKKLLSESMKGIGEKINFENKVHYATPQYRELKLLNEFRSDAKAFEKLNSTQNEEGTSQDFAKLIMERPNYVGYQFYYLNALRKEGLHENRAVALSNNNKIPKHLIQYWHEEKLPLPLELSTNSWKDKNPDYAYSLYNEYSAESFLKTHFDKEVVTAYQRCDIIAEKADLFRLAYLYQEGGIYADVDDLCLQGLNTLLAEHHSFIVYQEGLALGNNFIASHKGNRIIKASLDTCVRNLMNYVVEPSWYKTGPMLLTEQVIRQLASAQLSEAQNERIAVSIVSQETFRQYVKPHLPLSYKESGSNWLKAAYPSAD